MGLLSKLFGSSSVNFKELVGNGAILVDEFGDASCRERGWV